MLNNRGAGTGRLMIKPIVVPRKAVGDELHFYIVFTLQRCPGVHLPAGAGVVPECMQKGSRWPEWILSCLENRRPGHSCRFVLHSKESTRAAVWDTLKILTPPDMRIDHPLDINDPAVRKEMAELWEHLRGLTADDPQVAVIDGNGASFVAAMQEAEDHGPVRDRSIVNAYLGERSTAVANPETASDLRPGHRLESVDHRSLAEALYAAETQRARQNAARDAAKASPHQRGRQIIDPTGVYLVLQLGYVAPAMLQQFVAYHRTNGGLQGAEIAEFIEELWRTYSRPSEFFPVEGGAADQEGSEQQVQIHARRDFDPRFNDLIRERLSKNPEFANAVGRIEEAYHAFVLHLGQTEVRRLGRFIESSRHRIMTQDTSGSTAMAGSAGPFRLSGEVKAVRSSDAAVTGKPGFEDFMNQVRQYPGLMRRVAIAVRCSVKVSEAKVDDGGVITDIDDAANADLRKSLTGESEFFDGSATLVIWPHDDGHGNTPEKAFIPVQTACRIGHVNVPKINGDASERFFRAVPSAEGRQSFFGPKYDDQAQDALGEELWYGRHLMPRQLFTVTQDDLNLAGARAYNGFDGEPREGSGKATQTDTVNIYSNPVDRTGSPVSVAQAIDQKMEQGRLAARKMTEGTLAWLERAEKLDSVIRLASFQSGLERPVPLIGYQPDLFAEQLIQGTSILVQRRNRKTGAWGSLRALCRRMVAIGRAGDLFAGRFPRLRLFEEEGFISTSVTTAAKPLVGLIRRSIENPEQFETQRRFDLQVITVDNQLDTLCHCLPDPEVEFDAVPISGNFRPHLTWNDLQPGDFALVTPGNSCLEGDCRVRVAEMQVFPVFQSQPVNKLPANGNLWLLSAQNQLPPDMPGPALPLRGSERFPVVLNRHASRFVDEKGGQLKEPRFEFFTVEGDRRNYAIPWTKEKEQAVAFLPMTAVTPGDSKNKPHVLPDVILSPFGGGDVVTRWHLAPDQTLDVLRVPAPQKTASTPSGPSALAEFDQALIPDENLLNLGRLRAALDGSGMNILPGVQLSPGDIPKNPFEWSPVDARAGSGAGDAQNDLSLLRGFVEGVECQLAFRVTKAGNTWKFDGPPPAIVLPPNIRVTLPAPKLADLFKNVKPDDGTFRVEIRGVFQVKNGEIVADNVDQLSVVAPVEGTDRSVKILYRLSVRTLRTRELIDVFHEEPAVDWDAAAVSTGRFLHATDCRGKLVEIVTVQGPRGVTAKYWPQHALGTYVPGPAGKPARWCFADGDEIAVEPVSGLNLQTGRFEAAHRGSDKPAKLSALTADASRNDHHLVAGEVTALTVTRGRTESGISEPDQLHIELTDLHGKVWIIDHQINDAAPAMLQPASSLLPPRRLTDLSIGEFLITECDLAVASGSPVRARAVQPKLFDKTSTLRAAIALVGRIETDDSALTALAQTTEGTDRYRVVHLGSLAKTSSRSAKESNRIRIWCTADVEKSLRQIPADRVVTLPALQVIHAQTVAAFKTPVASAVQGSSPSRRPMHSMASELITRWNGWSLSVVAPGETDTPSDSDAKRSKLGLTIYRPNLSGPNSDRKTRFQLPPLRFDDCYRFVLRRIDLAGNHEYDERLNHLSDLDTTKAVAFNHLTSLYDRTHLCQARHRADKASSSCAPEQLFQPANIALAPQLGFPPGRPQPAFAPPDNRCDVTTAVASKPARSERFEFDSTVYLREEMLFLLTDVLGDWKPVTDDAYADLLPPPSPVENVLMTGRLDGLPADAVVSTIRRHERYLDTCDNLMGVDRKGNLNYFGDLSAEGFRVGIESPDCSMTGTPEKLPRESLGFFDRNWPGCRPVRVWLCSCARPERLRPDGPPVGLLAEEVAPDKKRDQVIVRLPAGTEGNLQLFHDCMGDTPWKTIRLVHATNGPWQRPEAVTLVERIAAAGDQPGLRRRIEGRMEVDIPSTGAYTVHAYWNEHRDESAAVHFAAGEGIARVAWDCCGLDEGTHAGVESVTITNPGFGLGSNAVVLVAPPRSAPQFKARIRKGQLESIEIVDPGEGCIFDLEICVGVLRSTAPKKVPARAVAYVNSAGQFDRVKITSRGAGLADDEHCRLCWPKAPYLEPICEGGKVTRVVVHQPGSGFQGDFPVRIIRRPPFLHAATAHVTSRNARGGIETVEVDSRGGWYGAPPFVVAMDEKGAGHGAVLSARLDAAGGIAEIVVHEAGRHYSDSVYLGIYTNQFQMPEQAIPKAEAGQRQDLCDISFDHTFNDLRARCVTYVVQASSRFRAYLDSMSEVNFAAPDIWRHVPRLSLKQDVTLVSGIRPSKPEVAYLMPSFEWTVRRGGKTLEEASGYFVERATGRIRVERIAQIRVYLHRPWHRSGHELLGVVIAPAILNTSRIAGDALDPEDQGVLNPARDASPKEPAVKSEKLAAYAIAGELRRSVTRWGFDPVWNEAAFAPVSVDHFESRREGPTYAQIELPGPGTGSTAGGGDSDQPLWLALHDVQYDAAKERWYADLRLRLRNASKSKNALPFVQLGLVSYQEHGVPGERTSPVTQCDMYKLLGERALEVERLDRRRLKIVLSGEFDDAAGGAPLPRRDVVASLLIRDRGLPDEVIGYVPAPSFRSPAIGPGWANQIPSSSGSAVLADALQETTLVRDDAGGKYSALLKIDSALFDEIEDRALVCHVAEYEVFPAAEGALDSGDEGLFWLEDQLCIRRAVFSYSFEIGRAQ